MFTVYVGTGPWCHYHRVSLL